MAGHKESSSGHHASGHHGRIVVLKVGSTLPSLREQRGDFEDWFRAGLAVEASGFAVVDAVRGDAFPATEEIAGVLVTGSSAMVTEGAAWSERAADWLRTLLSTEVPMLGVCYGHQLMAYAAGGEVADHPGGREIGTIHVERVAESDDDLLVGALPRHLVVQATHRQSVRTPPPGAERLGFNAHDAHQMLRFRARAWSVQFHPEFDANIVRTYLEARREAIASEGLDVDALLRDTQDSPHGAALLRRFAAICHEHASCREITASRQGA